jgi:biopolymer transport protein ExbB/TolQ
MEIVETLLVACVPAIISGMISFVLAKSQAKSENEKLRLSNQHEIDRLMEQHKVDIDAIREQHRLEMQSKEKEHQYKLEIMQKEHDNELIRQEKEQENTAKYNAMGTVVTGLVNGMLGGVMNSPEVREKMSKKILEGINKNSDSNQ